MRSWFRHRVKEKQGGRRRRLSGRTLVWAATFFVFAFTLGASVPAFADLTIVMDTDGERFETYLRENKIVTPAFDGGRMILQCSTGEVTLISPNGTYWQGRVEDMMADVPTPAEMFDDDEDMEEFSSFLAELFGEAPDIEDIQVRVTNMGDETVGDYQAQHYLVEINSGSGWRTHEEVWVSPELFAQMKAEVGDCVDVSREVYDEYASFAFLANPEMMAIINSDDYRAITQSSYEVRSRAVFEFFGMSMETVTEVVEVNTDTIDDEIFSVPENYQRLESTLELFGLSNLQDM